MAPSRLFRAAAVAVTLAAPAVAMRHRHSEEESFAKANASGTPKELPPDWKPPGYKCPYNLEGGTDWNFYFIEKHDEQVERSIRDMGWDVVKEVNECCNGVQLVPETACELFSCEKRDEALRQLYKSPKQECELSKTFNENTHNKYPIDTYSQYCPKKPLCTDQVLKSGTFSQASDGTDLGKSKGFLTSGHLIAIHYELDTSLPWYNVAGFKPSDKCTFAILQLQAGEQKLTTLGKFASGEKFGCDKQFGCDRVEVKYGDRLVWWDCDIKVMGSSGVRGYVDKVQQEVQKDAWAFTKSTDARAVLDLDGMSFRSLKATLTTKFSDFRPSVEAVHHEIFGLPPKLTAWWSVPEGNTIQFKLQHWDPKISMWRDDEDTKVLGDAFVNQLARDLVPGTDYRLTFKNLHELAGKARLWPGTYVYVRTHTSSCPSGLFKCCHFVGDDEKPVGSQCAYKRTFRRTCGTLTGPNGERAKGARDSDGKYDATACRFCDTSMAMPEVMAKAYQRHKKPVCEAITDKP